MLLCLVGSAIATCPFFLLSQSPNRAAGSRLWMPVTNDMILHLEQMKSFHRGLAAGEVYPRWEEDTNRGFGAPTTIYYPPGIYYVTSAFYFLLRDWTKTLFAAEWLIMLASGLAVYWYARRIMSWSAALVAMAAYIISPYHLLDQYQR